MKTASAAALSLAAGGWMNNLMVYLIQQFHINSIDAALIFNLVNGCTSLIPVIAAIIADSFLGSYVVVWISSFISFVVIIHMLGIMSKRIDASDPLFSFLKNNGVD